MNFIFQHLFSAEEEAHIFILFSFSVSKVAEKELKTRPMHGRSLVWPDMAVYNLTGRSIAPSVAMAGQNSDLDISCTADSFT